MEHGINPSRPFEPYTVKVWEEKTEQSTTDKRIYFREEKVNGIGQALFNGVAYKEAKDLNFIQKFFWTPLYITNEKNQSKKIYVKVNVLAKALGLSKERIDTNVKVFGTTEEEENRKLKEEIKQLKEHVKNNSLEAFVNARRAASESATDWLRKGAELEAVPSFDKLLDEEVKEQKISQFKNLALHKDDAEKLSNILYEIYKVDPKNFKKLEKSLPVILEYVRLNKNSFYQNYQKGISIIRKDQTPLPFDLELHMDKNNNFTVRVRFEERSFFGTDQPQTIIDLYTEAIFIRNPVNDSPPIMPERKKTPGIIGITSYCQAGETGELKEGVVVDPQPPGEVVQRITTVPLEERYKGMKKILGTLAEIHAQGLIHRDINPKAILVMKTKDNQGKDAYEFFLADRGLMTAVQQAKKESSTGGMKEFLAPEMKEFNSTTLSEKADVWSMGSILEVILQDFDQEEEAKKRDPEILELISDMKKEDPVLRCSASDAFERYSRILDHLKTQ